MDLGSPSYPPKGVNVWPSPIVSPKVLYTEHDMSPNRAGVGPVHRLYVAYGHKSKLEVSLDAAQTDVIRAPDDATQQYRNI